MSFNWTGITDPAQLLAMPNTQTGGWFWQAMLITLFVIVFITMIRYGWQISALVSSFIGLISSIFLYYADLVAFSSVLIFIGMILVMVPLIYWASPSENI